MGRTREIDLQYCKGLKDKKRRAGDFVVEAPLPAELCKILEGLRESQNVWK